MLCRPTLLLLVFTFGICTALSYRNLTRDNTRRWITVPSSSTPQRAECPTIVGCITLSTATAAPTDGCGDTTMSSDMWRCPPNAPRQRCYWPIQRGCRRVSGVGTCLCQNM